MKNITISISILTIGLTSCNTLPDKEPTTTDSLSTSGQTRGNVFIEDESKYGKAFIDELVAVNYEQTIKLTDNYMIVGPDTLIFPDPLPLNTSKVFKADKDNKHYELTITRTNLTNINFKFELSDNKKKVLHTETGEGVLGSLFFLGAESDEDNRTQEAYDVLEYRSTKDDCFFSARIESENVAGQRAKVSFGCSDISKPAIGLEESPVLKAE